jgi:hypothetical protein
LEHCRPAASQGTALLTRHVARFGVPAPEEPCGRCGVRADVGCKHRPAVGVKPLAIERAKEPERKDGRSRPGQMQGLLSHHQDRIASNLESAKRSLLPRSRNDR